MRIIWLFVLYLSASSLAFAESLAEREVTTIAVNYAAPEQVAAVIGPLLSPDSSVSVYQNQLVLNVTAEELAKIRGVLKQLDVRGRQLLASLRLESSGDESRRGVDIDAVVKSGDTVVTTRRGGRYSEERTTVRLANSRGASSGNDNQAVRATEGMPAYIATGMTAPVESYSLGPDGRPYYRQDYLQAVAGFYATTWVNEGTVRVSIDQSNDALEGRAISTQQLQSEVSGALGQWIPIGVVSTAATREDRGIGARAQSEQASTTQLFLKVELLD